MVTENKYWRLELKQSQAGERAGAGSALCAIKVLYLISWLMELWVGFTIWALWEHKLKQFSPPACYPAPRHTPHKPNLRSLWTTRILVNVFMFLTIASCKTQNWSFPIKFVFLIANQKTQLIQRCNHNDIDIYHLMCPAFLSQLWLTLWLSPSPPSYQFFVTTKKLASPASHAGILVSKYRSMATDLCTTLHYHKKCGHQDIGMSPPRWYWHFWTNFCNYEEWLLLIRRKLA